MLLEKEIQKILDELTLAESAKIDLGGSSITIKVFDNATKIFLSTPVYLGGNYIPKSVRNCLKQKAPFDTLNIRTTLEVEEEKFEIFLKFVGLVEQMTKQKFIDLLEDFSWLAEKWRDYLDENDKKDLLHIHAS
ncbi:MAG: hypothetical protein ACE5HI_14965 [bacterium]